MRFRNTVLAAAVIALLAAGVPAAERPPGDKPSGFTTLRPPVPLDTKAMNAMLRADRDKDGTLSREELEHYDMGLARRFNEVDRDRDGKLTLYEFEKLLTPQETASHR
jgi:hypothetical protein